MFLKIVEAKVSRKLNIRLSPTVWKALDEYIANAKASGQEVDLEGSVARYIEIGIKRAGKKTAV